jgi:hypothetical protein
MPSVLYVDTSRGALTLRRIIGDCVVIASGDMRGG